MYILVLFQKIEILSINKNKMKKTVSFDRCGKWRHLRLAYFTTENIQIQLFSLKCN